VAVTRVNSSSINASGTTATAFSTTFGVAVLAGDLIVVTGTCNGTHATNGMSVKDAVNNVNFTTIKEQQGSAASSRWLQSFYFFTPVDIASGTNITFTPYAANTQASFSVDVFRGCQGPGIISRAVVGATPASGTTSATGALASNVPAGDLVITGCFAASGTLTAGSPFTTGSTTTTTTSSANGYVLSASGSSTYASTWALGTSNTNANYVVSFAQAVGPTRINFAKASAASGAACTTASFTWQAGDLFVAVQGNEDGSTPPATPTFSGGTFTVPTGGGPYGNDASHCYARAVTCTVAGSGSGTISATSIIRAQNLYVWQFRNHNGVGVAGGVADLTLTTSLANVGSNNWVIMGMFDFTAQGAGRTGTPTVANEIDDIQNGALYTLWGADWSVQSGTVSYGVTAGSGTWSKVAVSVQEAGGAPAPLLVASRRDTRRAVQRASFY
jgi:hypothetical protein